MTKNLLLASLLLPILSGFAGITAQAEKAFEPIPTQSVGADYEVPAPIELKVFANFAIDRVDLKTQGAVTEMSYPLPVDLIGKEISVHVRGQLDSAGNGVLSNAFSQLNCVSDACSIHYTQLQINPDEVRAALIQRGVSGTELESRLKVAELFRSGDPAGIIRLNRP